MSPSTTAVHPSPSSSSSSTQPAAAAAAGSYQSSASNTVLDSPVKQHIRSAQRPKQIQLKTETHPLAHPNIVVSDNEPQPSLFFVEASLNVMGSIKPRGE